MEKKNGNWTIKKTRKVFDNDFFKVFNDQVVRPDGADGDYATIRFVPGVSVLPIDEENLVYLTKQFRYVAGEKTLEVVAGGVEDEEPLAAAKREVKEELGINAEEFEEIGTIQLDNSIIKAASTLFIARKLSFGKSDQDAAEEIETIKITLEEAVEKVVSGEITHAPSCILLMRAWMQLKNRNKK